MSADEVDTVHWKHNTQDEYFNYPAETALVSGAVFGRIAGAGAAAAVRQQ